MNDPEMEEAVASLTGDEAVLSLTLVMDARWVPEGPERQVRRERYRERFAMGLLRAIEQGWMPVSPIRVVDETRHSMVNWVREVPEEDWQYGLRVKMVRRPSPGLTVVIPTAMLYWRSKPGTWDAAIEERRG